MHAGTGQHDSQTDRPSMHAGTGQHAGLGFRVNGMQELDSMAVDDVPGVDRLRGTRADGVAGLGPRLRITGLGPVLRPPNRVQRPPTVRAQEDPLYLSYSGAALAIVVPPAPRRRQHH
jgi:hypothetical protein